MSFNQKKPLLILGVVLLITGLAYKGLKANKKHTQDLKTNQINKHLLDDHGHHQHPKKTIDSVPSSKKISNSSSTFTAKEVIKLGKDFKKNKPLLLKIINSSRKFESTPEPHTPEDLEEQEHGTLKILALRSLMENEKNRDVLFKDLSFIEENALDPTMKKVAKAASESLKKGRPFFKDLLEAIGKVGY